MRIKPAVAILLEPFAVLAVLIPMPTLARADGLFIECPSGRDGIASAVTTCPFADNVRRAYFTQDGNVVVAYSPVTDRSGLRNDVLPVYRTLHQRPKSGRDRVRWGNDADVVVW